jgi:hypothetical protein
VTPPPAKPPDSSRLDSTTAPHCLQGDALYRAKRALPILPPHTLVRHLKPVQRKSQLYNERLTEKETYPNGLHRHTSHRDEVSNHI